MIATTPRPRVSPATIAPGRIESPGLSCQEVRRSLLRAGKHESLLRTIAAAPRPADSRRMDARPGVPD